ncbi:MAG: hypothetical protein OCD02_14115 [Spirochaetaceae bacterium]
MGKTIELTNEDREILSELINISFGYAASLIADMFESFATLHAPSLEIIDVSELNDFVSKKFKDEDDIHLAAQMFKGTFEGESLFFIEKKSTLNLVKLLYKINDIEKDVREYDNDDIDGAILEISNIVSSSCVGKLSELLNTSVQFTAPSIDYKADHSVMFDDTGKEYDKVIIIETFLEFQEQQITGHLIILTNNSSFKWLQEALNIFMENC